MRNAKCEMMSERYLQLETRTGSGIHIWILQIVAQHEQIFFATHRFYRLPFCFQYYYHKLILSSSSSSSHRPTTHHLHDVIQYSTQTHTRARPVRLIENFFLTECDRNDMKMGDN